MDTTLQPVDYFALAGLAQKITQQFRAPAIYTTSPDQTRQLQAVQGKTPEYPYIFLNVQSWSAASDRYNANRLSRAGVPVSINTSGNQYEMARVVPANFEVEVTFVTNTQSGSDASLNSVSGFARRWLFARRNGSLNFTVNYGMTDFAITCTLSESVPTPPRESATDQPTEYRSQTNLTLHGYVSEPVLGKRGRVQEIILSEEVPPIPPGAQYIPF